MTMIVNAMPVVILTAETQTGKAVVKGVEISSLATLKIPLVIGQFIFCLLLIVSFSYSYQSLTFHCLISQ
jgi:hypothetical protein